MVFSSISQAADDGFIHVSKSIELNIGVNDVWQSIGDFCAIKDWHPAVADCKSYDDHGTFYRTLTLQDGAVISEKHAGEEDSSYSYYIKKSPLPVKAYKAMLKAEGDSSKTTVVWSARFRSKGASDEEAKSAIEDIFSAGLASIESSFKK